MYVFMKLQQTRSSRAVLLGGAGCRVEPQGWTPPVPYCRTHGPAPGGEFCFCCRGSGVTNGSTPPPQHTQGATNGCPPPAAMSNPRRPGSQPSRGGRTPWSPHGERGRLPPINR